MSGWLWKPDLRPDNSRGLTKMGSNVLRHLFTPCQAMLAEAGESFPDFNVSSLNGAKGGKIQLLSHHKLWIRKTQL